MSKFHLHTQKLVQGELTIKKVNIAFVFQVNCPGCFIYGIPIVNKLYESFQDKVGFIGVATAFEDFEFNNEANLKLLLENGAIVGETKKYYHTNYGLTAYSEKLHFPVAFDTITSSEQFINSNKIELMCNAISNFTHFSETEKELLITKVKAYYSQIPFIAETFTLNQLRGTPSFIIFDDHYTILGSYFGHQNEGVLKAQLDKLLS